MDTLSHELTILLFASSIPQNEGQAAEGKGIMDTTVVVESGTYGIVRHPQSLGAILTVCASVLISQHWLFALIGIFIGWVTPKWIREEEESLLMKFGDAYKRYMDKVPSMNFVLGTIRLLRRKSELEVDK